MVDVPRGFPCPKPTAAKQATISTLSTAIPSFFISSSSLRECFQLYMELFSRCHRQNKLGSAIIPPPPCLRQIVYSNKGVYGRGSSCQDDEIVPELPDIVVYIEALESRILNQRLERVRVASPFLLRTATPPLQAAEGKSVRELRRVGKRIAIGLQDDLWLVLHLMIAGRLHWSKPGVKLTPKRALAAMDFARGSVLLTEAGRSAARHCMSCKAKMACASSTRADWKFSLLTLIPSRHA